MAKNFDAKNFYNTVDTDFISAGTKVPEGFYACTSCGKCIPTLQDGVELPVCDECQSTYWMKI